MNYFELFNLPIDYQLDSNVLAQNYRRLQKQFHPDNFATASENEKMQAVQKSAQINDAYHSLNDPILRAEYLLKIQANVDIEQEKNIQDAEFLMAQIELHEALEVAQDFDELDALRDKVQCKQGIWLEQLEVHLGNSDTVQALQYVIRLRFMRRLQSLIEKKEDSLY